MKTGFRISLIVLMLGWLVFAFIAVWGMRQPEYIRLIIAGIAFFLCLMAMVGLIAHSSDKYFWDSVATLTKKREEADKNINDALRMKDVLIRKYLLDDQNHEFITKAIQAYGLTALTKLTGTNLSKEEKEELEHQVKLSNDIIAEKIRDHQFRIPYTKE